MKLKQFAVLSSLGMVAAPLVMQFGAIAMPAGFQTHKDSKGAVHFGGVPNTEVSVMVGGLTGTRNLTASACGTATIRPSSTRPIPATFQIGTSTINVANLPTQLLPRCLSTGQLEEARTSNFKTSDGSVVIVGQPANAQITMTFADSKERKVKMNACGFGKINNPSTTPFAGTTTFQVAGATSSTAYSVIETANPWLCRDGITYKPLS